MYTTKKIASGIYSIHSEDKGELEFTIEKEESTWVIRNMYNEVIESGKSKKEVFDNFKAMKRDYIKEMSKADLEHCIEAWTGHLELMQFSSEEKEEKRRLIDMSKIHVSMK